MYLQLTTNSRKHLMPHIYIWAVLTGFYLFVVQLLGVSFRSHILTNL